MTTENDLRDCLEPLVQGFKGMFQEPTEFEDELRNSLIEAFEDYLSLEAEKPRLNLVFRGSDAMTPPVTGLSLEEVTMEQVQDLAEQYVCRLYSDRKEAPMSLYDAEELKRKSISSMKLILMVHATGKPAFQHFKATRAVRS